MLYTTFGGTIDINLSRLYVGRVWNAYIHFFIIYIQALHIPTITVIEGAALISMFSKGVFEFNSHSNTINLLKCLQKREDHRLTAQVALAWFSLVKSSGTSISINVD